MAPKLVPYKHIRRRLKKTLYYGQNDRIMEKISLPFTEFTRDYFDQHSPFDHLSMKFASTLSRDACVNPCSLIVAMIYLERLRRADPQKFLESDPDDLYVGTLMLATKFLHEDGEPEYIYNDEWASSSNKPKKSINSLELDLLKTLDWRLVVSRSDFDGCLEWIERNVALNEAKKRSFTHLTYTELALLLSTPFSNPPNWSQDKNEPRLSFYEFFMEHFLNPFLTALSLATILYSTAVFSLYYSSVVSPSSTLLLTQPISLDQQSLLTVDWPPVIEATPTTETFVQPLDLQTSEDSKMEHYNLAVSKYQKSLCYLTPKNSSLFENYLDNGESKSSYQRSPKIYDNYGVSFLGIIIS